MKTVQNQAQYSTQEQVQNLRNLLIAKDYDPDNLTIVGLLDAIKEANKSGLYDAADFCVRMMGKNPTYKLEW